MLLEKSKTSKRAYSFSKMGCVQLQAVLPSMLKVAIEKERGLEKTRTRTRFII